MYTIPSRATLIAGAVKAALYGMELRRISELRHAGNAEWSEDKELANIREVAAAVYTGKRARTNNREVMGMLAYTQQSMRVSHEEWEDIVKVEFVERSGG